MISERTNRRILMCSMLSLLFLAACFQTKENKQGTKAEPSEKKAIALTHKPAKVSAPDGIKLLTERNRSSVEIKKLPMNTVVWVLDESKGKAGHWYRLRTRSGADGWSQGSVKFCSVQESQHLIALDNEALEDRLREMVLLAAEKELQARNPHPFSSLLAKTITSPLTPDNAGSNSYSVAVACFMKGDFLGTNKYQLDVKVDLFLELDKDRLDSSEIRVKAAAIISDKATEQMPLGEKILLLKSILPLL